MITTLKADSGTDRRDSDTLLQRAEISVRVRREMALKLNDQRVSPLVLMAQAKQRRELVRDLGRLAEALPDENYLADVAWTSGAAPAESIVDCSAQVVLAGDRRGYDAMDLLLDGQDFADHQRDTDPAIGFGFHYVDLDARGDDDSTLLDSDGLLDLVG